MAVGPEEDARIAKDVDRASEVLEVDEPDASNPPAPPQPRVKLYVHDDGATVVARKTNMFGCIPWFAVAAVCAVIDAIFHSHLLTFGAGIAATVVAVATWKPWMRSGSTLVEIRGSTVRLRPPGTGAGCTFDAQQILRFALRPLSELVSTSAIVIELVTGEMISTGIVLERGEQATVLVQRLDRVLRSVRGGTTLRA